MDQAGYISSAKRNLIKEWNRHKINIFVMSKEYKRIELASRNRDSLQTIAIPYLQVSQLERGTDNANMSSKSTVQTPHSKALQIGKVKQNRDEKRRVNFECCQTEGDQRFT